MRTEQADEIETRRKLAKEGSGNMDEPRMVLNIVSRSRRVIAKFAGLLRKKSRGMQSMKRNCQGCS
jgi:hypothetical protein